jgi:hypothetical protein
MPSSITPTTIDETFPVAGIDNDSQGFRDNFTIIKDNFVFAKNDIETLQEEVARVTTDNNFDYNTISKANLKESTLEYLGASGAGAGPVTLNYTAASYFALDDVRADSGSPLSVILAGWPDTDQYAEMTIELKASTSDPTSVIFSATPASGSITYHIDTGTTGLAYWTSRTITLSTAINDRDIIKAWTYDGGRNVYLKHIGRFVVIS